jgi:glycosyltransferase involved in cell wall biosynthesis
VVYYLSDYWPAAMDMHTAYWQAAPRRWYLRLPKAVLGRLALAWRARAGRPSLQFEHPICVSARVRDLLVAAGVPVQQARIIHGGTDVERFRHVRPRVFDCRPLRVLYAGQLVPHKGVHTPIQAMAKLVHERGLDEVHLTLVGAGHPAYERYLRQLVADLGLAGHVTFHGPAPKEQMPDILQAADVLVLPSIYEEPLARISQEAMAAGLLVIGTPTGGTSAILRDGETGLTFAPEDAAGLADRIAGLRAEPDRARQLSEVGRQTIWEGFTLDRMVADIEAYLRQCLAGAAGPARGEAG